MKKNPNANLKGMLKLIKASKKPLAPLFEAITNSLEAILELEADERTIDIEFNFNDQDNNAKRLDYVIVTDSGAGFNTNSYNRFNELLDNSKGYSNRGTGRLQFFHRFSEMNVESTYEESGSWFKRVFKCNKDNFIYGDSNEPSKNHQHQTSVTLKGYDPLFKDEEFFTSFTVESFASDIKSHFALRCYLEKDKDIPFPLIKLKFSYHIDNKTQEIEISAEDFPEPTASGNFQVHHSIPVLDKNSAIAWRRAQEKDPEKFNWLVFEFDSDGIHSHGAWLCSKDIPVEQIKNSLLTKGQGIEGKKKIAAFYGEYLDKPENVNDSVDSFNILSKSDVHEISSSLLEDEGYVYLDDIKKHADTELKSIYEEISKAQEDVERSVMALAKELGISTHIAKKTRKKVKISDTEDMITKTLHIEEAKYVAEKSNEARQVIKELNELDPTSENYQSEIEKKSSELTALIDAQNKEELSKYVVRREIVASLLDQILANQLKVQNVELPKGKNRDREGIIHDLIFKRKSDNSINDLWILNEEFVHYDGFSDLELSKMVLPNGEKLLKEDLDEMNMLGFKRNKRPDIFLFAGEGKCILVEFKEPNTDLSNYLQQMPKYCNLLATYSKIPIENFYCYLIGEEINPYADLNEYKLSVSGDWYRDSIPINNSEWKQIASIRMEVIKLSNIAKRAHRRNFSFASKLGLEEVLTINTATESKS